MRWTPRPYSGPNVGDTRERWRFALFPTGMDDGTICWLERYKVRQRYSVFYTVEYIRHYWETTNRFYP